MRITRFSSDDGTICLGLDLGDGTAEPLDGALSGPLRPRGERPPIRRHINGERMQEGHTSDMIFPVARSIAALNRDTTLLPGTPIPTGTPPGVGAARKPPRFPADGDRVGIEI